MASRPIPRNSAGLTWKQVCMLRTATTNMTVAECEAFLRRVMRLLDAWDQSTPTTDIALKKAMASVRALEDDKDPVKAAMNQIAEATP